MNRTKNKFSIVIPCYNEENTLAALVAAVLQLAGDDLELELLIVDDCSTDQSYQVAQKLQKEHPEIRLFKHDRNQGKGAALRTGFMQATGDFVGVQDADLEYNPLDYLPLIELLKSGEAEVVFGSRYLPHSPRRVLRFYHSQMNRFLTWCSNLFTDMQITDMETCYKLFKREVIQEIAPKLRENRFGFEPEITSYVAYGHYKIMEGAIDYRPRRFDEGKKISWKDGVRALYCILHYNAHRAPTLIQLPIYLLIGLISAGVNLGAFALLYPVLTGVYPGDGGLLAAVSGSFALSALTNYWLCIAILFRHRKGAGEIGKYLLTLLIMLGVDFGLTRGFLLLLNLPILSKFLSIVIGFFGNYFLRKYLVFRHK